MYALRKNIKHFMSDDLSYYCGTFIDGTKFWSRVDPEDALRNMRAMRFLGYEQEKEGIGDLETELINKMGVDMYACVEIKVNREWFLFGILDMDDRAHTEKILSGIFKPKGFPEDMSFCSKLVFEVVDTASTFSKNYLTFSELNENREKLSRIPHFFTELLKKTPVNMLVGYCNVLVIDEWLLKEYIEDARIIFCFSR